MYVLLSLRAYAYRMLIGACNLVLCPIHVFAGLGDEHLFTNGCFRRTPACSSCYPAQCDCGPEPHQHCPGGRNNGSEAADFCGGQLDPEGALATLPTVLTTWIGVHFGSVLFVTSSHRGRLTHWAVLSTAMSSGLGLDFDRLLPTCSCAT